jgi:hypothetical protein
MNPPKNQLSNRSNLTRFVFTLNNYTQEDYEALQKLPHIRALILGKELGASGTPHIQGACLLQKQVKFTTVKSWMPKAHIERMVSSPAQAFEYCRKDGDFWETGDVISKQGKRNDLARVSGLVSQGKTLQVIAQDPDNLGTIVKNYRGLQYLATLVSRSEPLRSKTIVWIHGNTGCGKTRACVEFAEGLGVSYWISGRDLQWFDGYVGQKIAIIDDFRWKHCPFSFFLRILDRYELDVPVKGGFARWNPQFIFVTTPKTITQTFDYEFRDPEDLRQVERRVNHVLNFPEHKKSLVWKGLEAIAKEGDYKSTPVAGNSDDKSCNISS